MVVRVQINSVMVSGYASRRSASDTLQGEVPLPFSLLSPFSKGFTLKGLNCIPLEQTLSFKGSTHFGRALMSREANRKS